MGYSHRIVEEHGNALALGLGRQSDEEAVICYLQKFSDDELMRALVGRLSDEELEEIVQLVMRLLRKHFTDAEYHRYFLKE